MGQTKYRADYKPLEYHIKHVDLTVELDEHNTIVTSQMQVQRTEHGTAKSTLHLDAESLELISVEVDGKKLKANQYEVTDNSLTIFKLPKDSIVTIKNKIDPTANESCEGLYRSEGVYTTQCESESFRRITYFQDRPDNLATYTTTVIGDQKENPLLLSNGNLIEQKELADGKHMCKFHDPNPKPSYLFALVAGDLRSVKDYAFTKAGEKVDLSIHVKGHKVNKTLHAMNALKAAFVWDEEKYGLPYDLNVYNIVGVPDFNAGAMENKGLNIFNDDSLLVSPYTSTDRDYQWIYTVVGHEFFHNYAGNRVTVRNWFELALKEGLATQKEREFLADQIGYTQPRILNVKTLRSLQFPEDAGPTAHPVRTDSYEDIGNFYTVTTYYKGSELLSMLSGLLGQDVWRAGVKEYFQRFDGTAATIDDFLATLSDVSGKDLTQFARWYSQAGTPNLHFTEHYDEAKKTYTLTVKQTCEPTPGQEEKLPFHIPIKMGLLDSNGKEMPLRLKGERKAQGKERVLELTESEQTFTFVGVKEHPYPSLLRDFSAPVKVAKSILDNDDLIFLMGHDTNEFNRWEAAQQLHQRVLLGLVEDIHAQNVLTLDPSYIEATQKVLLDDKLPPGLKADILSFPTDNELLESMKVFDPDALGQAMSFARAQLTKSLQKDLERTYQACQKGVRDEYTPEFSGKRQLKNFALNSLMCLGAQNANTPYLEWANEQYLRTRNMTDQLGALSSVHGQNHAKMSERARVMSQKMMDQFYDTWEYDPQVVDKWLQMQAQYDGPDTIKHMRDMLEHPAFDIKNPNNVRSLLRVFIRNNPKHFHAPSGEGYAFVADFCLTLDKFNPAMAAGIAKNMVLATNLDAARKDKLCEQLTRMNKSGISDKMSEIVTKALEGFSNPVPLANQVQQQEQEEAQEEVHVQKAAKQSSRLSRLLNEAQSFIGEIEEPLGTQAFLVQYGNDVKGESEPQQVRRASRLARK